MIKYRIAKLSDVNQIASIHYKVRDIYSEGFFSQMDIFFLRHYYRIILQDSNEIIICAENESGKILGFCSGTLNVSSQFVNIRKHKFSFVLAIIPSFIKRPSLIKAAWNRFSSIKTNDGHFVNQGGARSEYWAWDQQCRDSEASVELLEKLYSIMYILGAKEIFFEVDIVNKKIVRFHEINGATLINKVVLDDGRERLLMKYDLDKKYNKNNYGINYIYQRFCRSI